MSKRTISHAFSAGGIVIQQATPSGGAEIALVGRARERIWTLPKGTPAHGETREMTALREVREETGLEARIINEVGTIEYSFTRKGRVVKKQVFHYLMIAVGGSLEAHDHDMMRCGGFRWQRRRSVYRMTTKRTSCARRSH